MTKEQEVSHILDVWGTKSLLHPESRDDERLIAVKRILSLFEDVVDITTRKINFEKSVWGWRYKNNKYSDECIEAFTCYWTRVDDNGKMKFENQKAFKMGGRVAMFVKLNTQFAQKKQIQQLKNSLGSFNPLR